MDTEKTTSKSYISLNFIILLIINTLNGLAFYMSNPIMTTYLLSRDVPFHLTGIIASIISWIAMGFRPFAGLLTDRFNKKKLLMYAYGVTAACMGLYYCVSAPALIITIRVIHGIAFSITSTLSIAFATAFVPRESLSEGLAYLSLGNLIGSMIGPHIGSTIADTFSPAISFMTAGIFNAVAVVLIIILPYHWERKQQKFTISINDIFAKEVLVMMILVAIFSFGNGIISYYLKDYGTVRGISQITIFFLVNSLATVLIKPSLSKVQDRMGLAYILYPGFVSTIVSMILLAMAHDLPLVLVSAVLKAAGQGCCTAALQAESVKMVDDSRSGVAVSTCLIGGDIGNAMGPIIGAYVIEASGYSTVFLMNAVMLAAGILIYFAYTRRNQA